MCGGTLGDIGSSLADFGKSAISNIGNFFGVGDIGRLTGMGSILPKSGAPIGMFGLPQRYSTPMMGMAALAGGAYLGAGALGLTGQGGAGMGAAGLTEEEQLMASLNAMTDPEAAGAGGFMGGLLGGGGGLGGGTLSNALILGSGVFGLSQAAAMQRMAAAAQQQADPFGPQRGQYQEQLARLSADPSSVTKLPGYQFGFEQGNTALQRMMAAGGKLGSGEAEIAAQRYGQEYAGQFLSAEEARLAGLAGANIAPNPYGALTGQGMASDIASRSLATIGYGMGRMGY